MSASTSPTAPENRVSVENAAPLTATVLGWWRKDVPLEVSYRYWRDVHAVQVARAPGVYQYRLLALAKPERALLPDALTKNWTLDDRPHGMAEMLFLSQAEQQAFGHSRLITQFVHKDEQNLCDRNVTLSTIDHNAQTYVDRINQINHNGKPTFPGFVLTLKQRQDVETNAFRQHLIQQMAQRWSDNPEVLRLRLHLLEPFDESENSPCVSHDWATENRYQAWIELVVRDSAQLNQLWDDPLQHLQIISGVDAAAIDACYTLVANGKPTDVGLRGFLAVETIAQAKAELQKDPELLELLYGLKTE